MHLSYPDYSLPRCVEALPTEYRASILREAQPDQPPVDVDEHCLATLKGHQFLLEIADIAGKPMFMLKPGDGLMGCHTRQSIDCYQEFNAIRTKILSRIGAAGAGSASAVH